jgi:hypothetical protein
MKKFMLSLIAFAFVAIATAQVTDSTATAAVVNTTTEVSDDSLLKLNIYKFCDALGIPSSYNARYENIILTLCDAGVIIIKPETNPYVDGKPLGLKFDDGRTDMCYMYIGTGPQNEILKRNILKNRNLFVNGKLPAANAKKWQVVN